MWSLFFASALAAGPCPEGTGLTPDGRCEVLWAAVPAEGYWPSTPPAWVLSDRAGQATSAAGAWTGALGLAALAVGTTLDAGELQAAGFAGGAVGAGVLAAGGLGSARALGSGGRRAAGASAWCAVGGSVSGIAVAALANSLATRDAAARQWIGVGGGLVAGSYAVGGAQLFANRQARQPGGSSVGGGNQ